MDPAPVTAAPPEPHAPAEGSRPNLPADIAVLYEAHSRQVYYLALRLLSDPALAEDATHDVFLKAWRNLDRFEQRADIRTWLYRITLNHCSNLRTSWHARNIHTQADTLLFDALPGTTDDPFRAVEMAELGRRIQSVLDSLPDEYRLLLLLVADEDLSYAEVADLTDQSTDAVRGKLHRARKAFAAAFRTTD